MKHKNSINCWSVIVFDRKKNDSILCGNWKLGAYNVVVVKVMVVALVVLGGDFVG